MPTRMIDEAIVHGGAPLMQRRPARKGSQCHVERVRGDPNRRARPGLFPAETGAFHSRLAKADNH